MASADKLWFLVWRREGKRPFATSICGYARGDCLKQCHKIFGGKAGWRRARMDGAHLEKIEVVPSNADVTGLAPEQEGK